MGSGEGGGGRFEDRIEDLRGNTSLAEADDYMEQTIGECGRGEYNDNL